MLAVGDYVLVNEYIVPGVNASKNLDKIRKTPSRRGLDNGEFELYELEEFRGVPLQRAIGQVESILYLANGLWECKVKYVYSSPKTRWINIMNGRTTTSKWIQEVFREEDTRNGTHCLIKLNNYTMGEEYTYQELYAVAFAKKILGINSFDYTKLEKSLNNCTKSTTQEDIKDVKFDFSRALNILKECQPCITFSDAFIRAFLNTYS